MSRIGQHAAWLRGHLARRPYSTYPYPVALLQAIVASPAYRTDAERVADVRAVLAALDLVTRERAEGGEQS